MNKKKSTFYAVTHCYEIGDHDETRIIGLFSSRNKAKKAVKRFKQLPGFKHYPNGFSTTELSTAWEKAFSEGFFISPCGVDIPYWFAQWVGEV